MRLEPEDTALIGSAHARLNGKRWSELIVNTRKQTAEIAEVRQGIVPVVGSDVGLKFAD